ncbi:glucuronate isomerase, partial [Enterovibrio norvegicus]|uniref:glucuronate isomerase n=1 Tax=Enterovibrio norvegicus TaxID=188144 RepID=UPI0005528270
SSDLDPIDSLEHHKTISADTTFDVQVLPSWRPDKAFKIELDAFADYLQKLGEVADVNIRCFDDLLTALDKRLAHFDAHGCRAADH